MNAFITFLHATSRADSSQPARRICRPGPPLPPSDSKLHNVLIIGDSISLGAMGDLTKDLASVATVEHAPYSSDGGALDVKYAMDVDQVMTGAGSGPPWVPGHSAAVRYGDGCLNGTFLSSTTQQETQYDVISFNYGVHDVCYSGYLEEWVPLPLYEASIRAIKRTLQATGAKVVFQASTPVEYNLTTNARILGYNAAAKAVMAEAPVAAYSDLYAAVVAVCGNPPYNAPSIPNSPNCSISDYGGVHYHEGGWELLATTAAASITALFAGTTPRHLVEPTLARASAPGSVACNASALFAAAAKDGATMGHEGDVPWRAPAFAASKACTFPQRFADMHCNLYTAVPNITSAEACEAAASKACSAAGSPTNAWTYTAQQPDPNVKEHCFIGELTSLAECYIAPASDGWTGGADFAAATGTRCPPNSTCMANAYSTTNIGCCIGYGTEAVTCKDHVHCCPEGWSCTNECSLGQCGCVPPPLNA